MPAKPWYLMSSSEKSKSPRLTSNPKVVLGLLNYVFLPYPFIGPRFCGVTMAMGCLYIPNPNVCALCVMIVSQFEDMYHQMLGWLIESSGRQ